MSSTSSTTTPPPTLLIGSDTNTGLPTALTTLEALVRLIETSEQSVSSLMVQINTVTEIRDKQESSNAIALYDAKIKVLKEQLLNEQFTLACTRKNAIAAWFNCVMDSCPECKKCDEKQSPETKHSHSLSPEILATFPAFPMGRKDLSRFCKFTQKRTLHLCKTRPDFCRVQQTPCMEYIGGHEECVRCTLCNDISIPGRSPVYGKLLLHDACRRRLRIHMSADQKQSLPWL